MNRTALFLLIVLVLPACADDPIAPREVTPPKSPEFAIVGPIQQVSAGGYHTCALASDGSVECWGYNSQGEADAPAGSFTQVSAGWYILGHTCAVASGDGSVQCWGNDSDGQASAPAGSFIQVSAGLVHTCAVTSDGGVQCWGDDSFGRTSAPAGSFIQVSAGWAHSCAVASDGSVQCWGDDEYGKASAPAGSFVQVSAGRFHTCALASDGSVQCWGLDGSGQASPPAGSFTQVSAGERHTCAVASDGGLECWGDDLISQASALAGSFTQVSAGSGHTCAVASSDGGVQCWGVGDYGEASPPAGSFTQVSAGGFHTCAVARDGGVQCWGWDSDGQASPPAGSFVQVSAGRLHTCALASDGSVECWGEDAFDISSAPDGSFIQVSAGNSYTCAVASSDGSVKCWGRDAYGRASPPAGSFTQVSAGRYHTCAVASSDGSVECWGDDEYGKASAPAGSFIQVSAGLSHTCAVASDGSVECWGDESLGRTTAPAGSFTQVSAGLNHTCALASDGSLECWGVLITTKYVSGGSTPPGTEVEVTPPDETTGEPSGVTITFGEVTGQGETTVSTGGTGKPLPDGFKLGSPPVYYDVNTTAEYDPPITVCIDYTEYADEWFGGNENKEENLKLMHEEIIPGTCTDETDPSTCETRWVDVTTTHDLEEDIICGEVSSLSLFVVAETNTVPVAAVGGPYAVGEGSPIALSFSGIDADGDALTYAWDLGDGTTGTGDTPPTAHTYLDNGTYPITLTVADAYGGMHTATTVATIANVAPSVGPVTAPSEPAAVGTNVTVGADFTDPGIKDTHTATIDWGDGTVSPATVSETESSGSVTGSYGYATAGVYTVKVSVTDKDGDVGESVYEFVVVYDPSGGFVTGGGWIDSEPGAYIPDPSLRGKATFGFVSKYKKGTEELIGNTEFQFRAGDLNFHSTAYEWLVVTGGDYAKFKGSGTINGVGNYRFMLWAADGSPDTFRIRIWEEDELGNEAVTYDNGSDRAIGGGSIVVHTN